MKKIIFFLISLPFTLIGQETILISAVMDGDVPGGLPKMIELYAKTDIADASIFGFESGNNGNAAAGVEFALPAVSLSAGEFVYITTNQTELEAYFTYTDDGETINPLEGKKIYESTAANVNGDDAIILYRNNIAVDFYGVVGTDGSGEPWEYTDSYVQRKFDKGPNTTFDVSEWTISSVNGCETTNADCLTKSTIGSYLYAATVTEISSNTTWTGNKTISGKVVVKDGATLTIEPGTVVKAAFAANPVDATALIVAKGGKLNAVGTAAKPIIFTTEYDDLTAEDVAATNQKLVSTLNNGASANDLTTRGLWGGIIMLGKGIVGEDGGEDDIEGVAEGYDFTTYGGNVADDNSGTLDYVSIRHGGATIANGDEINGLTLGGVGSGTTISNIEIISNDDDGIEFFGGNVDVTNILIFNQKDDAIDIDEAYAGTITNAYVAMGADSDNVFEIDGSEDSTGNVTGSYTIDGVTAYQAYDNSGKLDQYGHWKSAATGANKNIVFKGFAAGTYLEGVEKATFDAGTLTFSNLDFVTTDNLATVNSVSSRSEADELAELTATHAETLATQAFNTGANEGKFAGWTAYGSVNPFTVNVGDGNLTYISQDTTWEGNYTMTGKVVVEDGATLTIKAGTVVKATFTANPVDATALIVAKGGKLNAVGTAAKPIIFTTEYDDLTAEDVAATNQKLVSTLNNGASANDLTTRGLWGGIIMLGKGIVGEDGGEDDIEGVAEGYDFTTYGGNVADDNSGTLDYVSIRHGGATIANGDEINGLTLGGVGSGTTISNIEIISNDDDGIEFFGGNVDVTNILIFNQKDDAIDIDEAYAGTITNAYVAMGADSDNVFEIDGSEDSTGNVTGSYTIDGVTAYQAYDNSGKLDQYGHWKSAATGANKNIVFKGFAAGTYLEGVEKATFDAGTLTFSNLDFVTTDNLATVNSVSSRSETDELAELTATHAETLATQAFNTGANEGKFAGWTAYGSVNPFTVNVGDGNLTYISQDTTWEGNYTMTGKVVVEDGATLTIKAGTVVKATFTANPVDATALIVAKGGKLNAVGTAAKPIIFTTEYDDLTAEDVAATNQKLVSTLNNGASANDLTTRGLWGGIIMLGKGIVGEDGGEDDIEGVAEGYDFTTYGGNVADDNSGTLDYVSIRHGGATIANGDEINGLTLGGVGSGTTISNIEIISNDDDGIEFFGGNVDVTNILIFNQKDDAIDIDEAYAGTITNAYVAMGADSDNVFEIDGSEDSTGNVTGSYTIDGVTAYQAYDNSGKLDQYGHWKSAATGANKNIVFKGFAAGTYLEGVEKATFDAGTLTFSNLDFVTTDNLATVNSVSSRSETDELAELTATHAETLATQAFNTGANEGKFAGWTAYGSVNPFTVNVGDGNLTYISQDTTWEGNYTMTGKVVVEDGATLTIKAGTVVKATFTANPVDATALIVAKGGKLNAVGTAAKPIIFTTEYDDLTAEDVAATNQKLVSTLNNGASANDLTTRGLWGGIIMLGKGIVGEDGGEDDIEGVAEGYDFTTYGGNVADDNSGTLDYVSIRHGGATIANGDEINGLTLGGVGSGTTISNIEIISNDDDGIEFFGGNVDVTNILIFNQKDDAIDIDEAYAGTITNAYVAMGADSDNVFEIDGSEDSTGNVTGSYTIDGVTAYQAYDNSGKLDQYGHWKSAATGANKNIVFKGFAAGTYLEGVEKATFDAGTLTFSNLDFVTTDNLATVNSVSSRSETDELAELTATHAETLATQASDTGANESEFIGWTAYDFNNEGALSIGAVIDIQDSISFYPNPTDGLINVISERKINTINVYAVTGQLIKSATDVKSIDIKEVTPGIYIIEVTTEEQKVLGRLIRK